MVNKLRNFLVVAEVLTDPSALVGACWMYSAKSLDYVIYRMETERLILPICRFCGLVGGVDSQVYFL